MAHQHVEKIKALKLSLPFGIDEATAEQNGTVYSVINGVFSDLASIADGLKTKQIDGGRVQFCEKTLDGAKELKTLFLAIATLIRKGRSPSEINQLFKPGNKIAIKIHNVRDNIGINVRDPLAKGTNGSNRVKLGELVENGIFTPIRNELMKLLEKHVNA